LKNGVEIFFGEALYSAWTRAVSQQDKNGNTKKPIQETVEEPAAISYFMLFSCGFLFFLLKTTLYSLLFLYVSKRIRIGG
jgi:hypothetical protein